ncbi:helix-turn-helix domain-containing protein [Enterococcus faecalis]
MDYREFLKKARGKKSQKKFGEELGVQWEHYARIERGRAQPSIKWLQEVAEKLNADVSISITSRDSQKEPEQMTLELPNEKEQ